MAARLLERTLRSRARWPGFLLVLGVVGFFLRAGLVRSRTTTEMIQPGTVLSVRFDRILSSSRVHLGESFEGRTVLPNRGGSPEQSQSQREAEVEGRCVAVRRNNASRPGYLRLVLTGIRDQHGRTVPLATETVSLWGASASQGEPGQAHRAAPAEVSTVDFLVVEPATLEQRGEKVSAIR
jgi:hypothetical protein